LIHVTNSLLDGASSLLLSPLWAVGGPAATAATHLLALFLVVVGPAWDYFEMRPLKAAPTHKGRMRYYVRTFLWLWIATGVACWTQGIRALTTLRGMGIHGEWLERHGWAWWVLAGVIALIVIVQLVLPVVQVSLKYRHREFLEPKQLQPLRFFLPSATVERQWFALLSVTAGVCEELLFRGFLLRYLHTWPLHLGLLWAVLVAAVVFGTHHLYQGAKGFASTSVGGLLFAGILLVTGSLWVGMVYHAAADMSLLLYWRPRQEAAQGTG
jgi:uncharacterized protein